MLLSAPLNGEKKILNLSPCTHPESSRAPVRAGKSAFPDVLESSTSQAEQWEEGLPLPCQECSP